MLWCKPNRWKNNSLHIGPTGGKPPTNIQLYTLEMHSNQLIGYTECIETKPITKESVLLSAMEIQPYRYCWKTKLHCTRMTRNTSSYHWNKTFRYWPRKLIGNHKLSNPIIIQPPLGPGLNVLINRMVLISGLSYFKQTYFIFKLVIHPNHFYFQ